MENTNCYIFAFATFGHPNDFRQTPFQYSNPVVAKQIKVFDLSNAIKIFPNTTVYSIRKERIGNSNLISYSIYTYAQEQSSKRDGTFIGSSITLENKLTDEIYIINNLNEFHQKLTEKNLNNNVLMVNHSKDFTPVSTLSEFDKINNPQIEINALNFTANNKSLVIYCETSPNKLAVFFNKAIDLLNNYDTIYFTNSKDVAEYVNNKGLFKLIQNAGDKQDFENEIKYLFEERKRKRESSISEFESEIQKLNDDKARTILEYKTQLEVNERTHFENSNSIIQAKNDINQIDMIYDYFSKMTKELADKLRHQHLKLEEAKQIHNNHKIQFIEAISQLKKPNLISKIAKPKPQSNLKTENQNYEQKPNFIGKNINSKGIKLDTFKVTTLVLAISLIITWVYVLVFKTSEKPLTTKETYQEIETPIKPNLSPPIELLPLNPTPNAELNENDYRNVAKKIKYNSNILEIVTVIFDKNPTDIKKRYEGQKELYSKHLFDLNKDCFEEKNNSYIFSKDTLRHIPSFTE